MNVAPNLFARADQSCQDSSDYEVVKHWEQKEKIHRTEALDHMEPPQVTSFGLYSWLGRLHVHVLWKTKLRDAVEILYFSARRRVAKVFSERVKYPLWLG